jgi:hypothetical protein
VYVPSALQSPLTLTLPVTFPPVNFPEIVRLSSAGSSDGSPWNVALTRPLVIFALLPFDPDGGYATVMLKFDEPHDA